MTPEQIQQNNANVVAKATGGRPVHPTAFGSAAYLKAAELGISPGVTPAAYHAYRQRYDNSMVQRAVNNAIMAAGGTPMYPSASGSAAHLEIARLSTLNPRFTPPSNSRHQSWTLQESFGLQKIHRHQESTPENQGWSDWHYFGPDMHSMVTAQNADGGIEFFGLQDDRILHKRWQQGGNWSDWNSYEGQYERLRIGRNTGDRLELFATSKNHQLFNMWQNYPGSEEWSGPNFLGWSSHSNVAVETNRWGMMEVFSSKEDGTLAHHWQIEPNGGWSDEYIHGNLPGNVELWRPTLGKNRYGGLELFVQDSRGDVYMKWQKEGGDWSEWDNFRGHLGTAMEVGNNNHGNLELFALGGDSFPNQRILHKWQYQTHDRGLTWSDWHSFSEAGIFNPGGPLMIRNQHGELELFAHGKDGLIYTNKLLEDRWLGWEKILGTTYGIPTVSKNHANHLELFATRPTGSGDAIYHKWKYW